MRFLLSEKKNYRICVGIHVHAEPEALRETLASLRTSTKLPFELVLLPDGPDQETRAFLESIHDIQQLCTAEPLGPPACFNRFVSSNDADILVFVESGVLFGPEWLDRILGSLDADPHNGLAGPSTNLSWNEQCIFPNSHETEIIKLANEAEKRFGKEIRILEPLHSLADFCYIVKREVIETIGAVDEDYGLGPCWEMDYNIRALRAGFRGIWVCNSYVHRAPFTERRKRMESLRFESNKHLYQDKFCGLELEHRRHNYCRHCNGERCPYFAPKNRIQIHLPLAEAKKKFQKRKSTIHSDQIDIESEIHHAQTIREFPLVSCIMPTHNRRVFVPHAISYFLHQDYPNRELIIIDDGTDPIKDLIPDDSRIRYIRYEHRITIGAARNIACREAKGEIIIHWDDDDWMANWRLSYQVAGLLNQKADVCGLNKIIFLEPVTGRSWQYVYPEKERPWVSGNTLCYTRTFWSMNNFPDINIGEDTRFIWNKHLTNIAILADSTFYVALIHPGNTSYKRKSDNRWHSFESEKIRAIMGDDLTFYAHIFQGEKTGENIQQNVHEILVKSSFPLVSCIMPTYNRRLFVPQAIKYFLRQDYPNKELVILDNGADKVMDLIPKDDRIKYIRVEGKATIGYMRNLAVERSKGKIIAHWDDDDWYAENRISYQVQPLLEGKAEVCGIDTGFIYNLQENSFWSCNPGLHARMFYADIHGGSIVFLKKLWEKYSKYPEVSLAEDAGFLRAISKKTRITKLQNKNIFIYIRHGSNAWKFICGKFLNPSDWEHIPAPAFLPKDDFRFYQNFRAEQPVKKLDRYLSLPKLDGNDK